MTKRAKAATALSVVASTAIVAAVLLTQPSDSVSEPPASRDDAKLVRVFGGITLNQPIWMEQIPGDDSHFYAIEQAGRIVTWSAASGVGKSVVLDIRDRVESGGEKGLLGMAFHPKFASNGWVFVNYTTNARGKLETRVSRFTASKPVAGQKAAFSKASEKVLLVVEQPYANHNGGQVSFGPDGHLYIGYGDGGLAGDPQGHGQNKSTLLGTIARIHVDGADKYTIPADNPFAKGGGAPEVFAWGLRNPWRFSFDAKTGALWAGDVGQNAWEEIDVIEKGRNYGWNHREGRHCYDPPMHLKVLGSGGCEAKGLTDPVHDYSQKLGDESVTGGYVYRGAKVPSLAGRYVYGDFVSGRIWTFDAATKRGHELLLDTDLNISSFAQDNARELYVLSYGDGKVYKFVP